MWIQTIEDFRKVNPLLDEALLCTAISELGEIHCAYFEGNTDSGLLGRFVTSYAYVNGWTITITQVTHVKG